MSHHTVSHHTVSSPEDDRKLRNNEWLKWRSPNVQRVCGYSTKMGFTSAAAIKHTLDIAFDLHVNGFVDRGSIEFQIEHIIKARVRAKVPMYSVKWKCNDTLPEHLGDIKLEGLHFAVVLEHLHPNLVSSFKAEREKKTKSRSKSTNKATSYNGCSGGNTKQKQMDRQNREELEEINELLSSVSLQNSTKKPSRKQALVERHRAQNKRSKSNIKSPQKRKFGKCLLSDSDASASDHEDERKGNGIMMKRQRKQTKPRVGWDCQICTFWNEGEGKLCEMCGAINKHSKEQRHEQPLDLSALLGTLSISQSPHRSGEADAVWDVSVEKDIEQKKRMKRPPNIDRMPKRKENEKRKKNICKTSLMNTSSTTASWKCHRCKTSIAIDIFECPNCG